MAAWIVMLKISLVLLLLHCRGFPYIWALWNVKCILNRGKTHSAISVELESLYILVMLSPCAFR